VKVRIAMVGTRGVPARYGGFETCVEQVGQRLVKSGHDVVVYCRTTAGPDELEEYPTEHLGMKLVYLPAVPKKAVETLSHTALSAMHLMVHPADVALVFNSANAPFVPILRARGIPVATHVDGLEWMRGKWQGAGRVYYRMAESMAVRWSDALIADAQGIADYYDAEFGAPTELIAYGAPILVNERSELIEDLGLSTRRYHLVVARFEPENHVDVIVDGYRRSNARLPLVVVGSAPYADEYTARIRSLCDDRVRLLGSVWNQDLLDQLYANSATYLHGHSVGGTNPSLLRAAGAGAATIAYDVNFNREVLERSGRYFRTAEDVAAEIEIAEKDEYETVRRGALARARALRYDWDEVAGRYEQLCTRLATAGVTPRRRRAGSASGRRRGVVLS
jgi:glycosyltransferase involved in cell wall biosynthesis